MIIVKVSLGLEIKRIALDDSGATLQSILSLLKILFPVLENQPFVLKYKDDEGDTISILTDLELKECFRQVLEKKTSQTPVLRLWIDTGNSQNQPMPLKEGLYFLFVFCSLCLELRVAVLLEISL
jgi:hypothetical protein